MKGTPLYYNTLLSSSQFDEHWDDVAKVPFMTGRNGLNTFLSYENESSIELKAEFIVEQNLRGAIIWEITGDYIETSPGSGIISSTPLATKLNDVFCNYTPGNGNVGLFENLTHANQVYPNPVISNEVTVNGTYTNYIINTVDGKELTQGTIPISGVISLPENIANGTYLISLIGSESSETSRLQILR